MSRTDRSDTHDESVLLATVATDEPTEGGPTHERLAGGMELLAFSDVESLTRTLTHKRLELLDAVRRERPESIAEAARVVDRDVKNVHTELRQFEELNVVSFVDEGRAKRPVVRFDEIRVRVRFDDRTGDPVDRSYARGSETPEQVYSRITDAFIALDTAARVTYVNERAEKLLERSAEELIGSVIWKAFPDALGTAFEKEYRRAVRTGEPIDHETYYPPLDTWFAVRAYPSETGLTAYFRDVTERKRRERQLERQRDELAAVNHLNRVVQGIVRSIVESSSRERVEREVCERLVGSDSYAFAWMGRVERDDDEVTPSRSAGDEASYLAQIRTSIDDGDPRGQGPTGTAIRTHQPQFVQDLRTDVDYEPWRDEATKRGFRSSAAIPLACDDRLYGVLNLYSTRSNAFTKPVREAIGLLGSVIGHAIHAIEQRKAIVSNSVMELELRNEALGRRLVGETADVSLIVERTVPSGDGRAFHFVTVTGLSTEEFVDRMAGFSVVEEVTLLDDGDDGERLFRLTISDRSMIETLASYGGRLRRFRATADGSRMVVELPPSAHVREVLEDVNEIYPGTALVGQRTLEREPRTVGEVYGALLDRLTKKQRAALETAYFAGYFDWPRTATGEEVADMLGIAAPTFANHLRVAERTILDAFLEDDSVGR
ncbi:bacterio-opsin activator domain-containing protein [Halalkalicoccus ordinarius]|uniref:bacterio-opsin activator domain-containing protein n=1 Tax=Halalkalicoccus ordinarius TaxID=3116651 RepID=UPI00300E7BC3